MSTFIQLKKNPRTHKKRSSRIQALQLCPQRKGVCIKVYTTTPKKPHSGIRKVAKVKLTTGYRIIAYIQGIKHTIQKHSTVLVRGGRTKDLPGLKFKTIRGKFDLLGIKDRTKKRSKYGVKKLKD